MPRQNNKGRTMQRKATGRCYTLWRSQWSVDILLENQHFEHLVNWNILVAKGKKINRDSVSSGEWKRKRPTLNLLHAFLKKKTFLEKVAKEGESPVRQNHCLDEAIMCMQYKVDIMSKTRTFLVWTKGDHPLSLNIIVLTDSEQVPWGKGEKNPKWGVKQTPKTQSLQTVEAFFLKKVTAYLLYNGSASKSIKHA